MDQLVIAPICLLILAHWFSDFVLQSDWQAINKSKNWLALGSHVGIYSLSMIVTMFVFFLVGALFKGYEASIWLVLFIQFMFPWILVNALLHFVTDAITSRISSYLWLKGDRHNFFVMVGFDQVIHLWTLILTFVYFFYHARIG